MQHCEFIEIPIKNKCKEINRTSNLDIHTDMWIKHKNGNWFEWSNSNFLNIT